MKTTRVLALLIIALACGACISHNLPKDAYLRGVKSKISTPWGTGELDVQEAATGAAGVKAAGLK